MSGGNTNSGFPCGIGQNDLEKCGAGLKCDPDSNTCLDPCVSAAIRQAYNVGGMGTWYQNDPVKPDYKKCVQGVGSSSGASQNSQGNNVNVPASNALNKRQNDNTNRFCLCAIDVGCGPAPPEPAVGLVFNIMHLTPNYNSKGHSNRTYGDYGPAAKCTGGNYSCDRPRITIAAMWLKRDDNKEICVEGACCKNGGDGLHKATDPRITPAGQVECPCGDGVQDCSEVLAGNVKNGIAQTYGVNTKGCEALEFYCENINSCYYSGAFSNGVMNLFDIGPTDFGGFTAFKVTTTSPPKGETYEINIYGHTGEKGGCKGKVWVHEMTKDKTNSLDVKSFRSAGPPRQEGNWSYPRSAPSATNPNSYTLCASTIGGPDPKALVDANGSGAAALLATITILPDATWTIS